MIRNKMPLLIKSKNDQRGYKYSKNNDLLVQQPWWFQQYYNQKEAMAQINANNRNLQASAAQYQINPSVYTLKQLDKLISNNCQLIERVQVWTNRFRYSNRQTALHDCEKSMITYFQSQLSREIMNVFYLKQKINQISQQLDHQAFFNNSRYQNANNSYHNSSFHLNASIQVQDRNKIVQQVNEKIENLNLLLRRMNQVVVGQGDLINRIDQNLLLTHSNMKKGNEQLRTRVSKEEGTGQFTCEGKVNSVISGLYFLNLGIILLFLLKHLIF